MNDTKNEDPSREASVWKGMFSDANHSYQVLSLEVSRLNLENTRLRAELAQRTAELAKSNAERDEARRWVCELWEKYQPATSSMTARDYAAECGWDCFEKKADPLAEMWAALESYQPMADRDGHGESWRAMCEERTEEAAWAAYMARQGSSHVRAAAYCAWQQAQRDANARRLSKDAVKWAAGTVEAIRRAKEAKP